MKVLNQLDEEILAIPDILRNGQIRSLNYDNVQ